MTFVTLLFITTTLANLPKYEDMSNTDRVSRVTELVQQERVTNLPYGVLMKKVRVLDMSSSVWPHIFRIAHIPKLPVLKKYRVCRHLPIQLFRNMVHQYFVTNVTHPDPYEQEKAYRTIRRIEDKMESFCKHFRQLEINYNTLITQTTAEVQRQHNLMKDLVLPNTHLQKLPTVDTRTQRSPTPAPVFPAASTDSAAHTLHTSHQNTTNTTLNKRDLSFLGKATGNFFGLATTTDLQELWNAIWHLHKNSVNISEGLNTFADHMLSISKLDRTRLDHLTQTMEKALHGINNLQRRLKEIQIIDAVDTAYENMIQRILIEAFTDISVLQDAVNNYLTYVQDRILALTSLNHHILSPALVSPAQLETALKGIEQELLHNYVPFRFGFDSLDYFYSVPSTSYLADDNFLYVEIKIPLTVMSAHYHIYEVHSVPLTAGKGTTQYTEISHLPPFLGVSGQGDTYITLDETFLNSCSGIGIQRCDTRIMETSILVPSCILGLFLNDMNMTNQYCHTDLILTPSLPETAIDIGQGSFFISAMDTKSDWVISCPHRKPRTIMACRSCIVTLDCRCNLKTPSAFISASLNGCSNTSSTSGITKTFVPNLMWINNLANFTQKDFDKYLQPAPLNVDPIETLPELPIP